MTLENQFKIGSLHVEVFDLNEFRGLVRSAHERLIDSQIASLSYSSRFDLAYNAAHGFALAALRASGYRTDKRYMVFQCLVHTVAIKASKVRIFSLCHERRNLAEYEGHMEPDEPLLAELIECSIQLEGLIKHPPSQSSQTE